MVNFFRILYNAYNERYSTLLKRKTIMPSATKVTKENLEYIVYYATMCKLNLDYLKDTMEFNAEDGVNTYLITDGTIEEHNVTFTEVTEPDFRANWKFTDFETSTFEKIERI